MGRLPPVTNAAAVSGNVRDRPPRHCEFTIKAQNAQMPAQRVWGNTAAPGAVPCRRQTPTITIPASRSRRPTATTSDALDDGETVNVTMRDAGGDRDSSAGWWVRTPRVRGRDPRHVDPDLRRRPGQGLRRRVLLQHRRRGRRAQQLRRPRHGYALLVDGGDYNGQSITGIGLDKSAAIYYRAMTAYQTVFTDFEDHANALESSCADLTGTQVNTLTVAAEHRAPRGRDDHGRRLRIRPAMIAAVELRQEPVQCNFQPMFDLGVPPLCGGGSKQNVVWRENFSDGLAGWTTAQQIMFPQGFGAPWQAVPSGPKEHASPAAYGPGPDEGNCSGAAGDFSSSIRSSARRSRPAGRSP